MPNATTPVIVQGDREIYPKDIDHIRIVLQRFPGLPRKEVALTLCETLNWLTPAGRPKIDACFKLLHRLEQAALIRLPAKRELESEADTRPVR